MCMSISYLRGQGLIIACTLSCPGLLGNQAHLFIHQKLLTESQRVGLTLPTPFHIEAHPTVSKSILNEDQHIHCVGEQTQSHAPAVV